VSGAERQLRAHQPGRVAEAGGQAAPASPEGEPAGGRQTLRLPALDPRARAGRRGTLRGRLVLAFVAVAILTALVIGVTTSSLLRVVAERNAVGQLQEQAAAIADNNAGIGRPNRALNQLCQTRRVLRVSGTEVYVIGIDGRVTVPPCLVTLAPLTPVPRAATGSALEAAPTVSGVDGGYAYAAARLFDPGGCPGPGCRGGADRRQELGILLVRPVRAVGADLLGGVVSRLLVATLLAVAVAGVVAWVLAGRLTAPLRQLALAARRLGTGQLETRVAQEGDDEVAEVAVAFNDLAAGIERQQAEQRSFLASVGHELKTPLTTIQGNVEALLDGTVTDEAGRRRSLERLHTETHRLTRLVADLLELGRTGRGRFTVALTDADAATVLRDAGEAAALLASGRQIPFELRVPGPLPARIDPGRLRQVLDNLLSNAIRVTPPGHPVLLAARALADGSVEAVVADRGPGIAQEDLPHTFERGYLWARYRGTRTVGSGLGLAIVKGLCDAMGVSIWAEETADGGGLTVHLLLPASEV
jgi:two-component system, OmpR family, sensor kinase